jgi:CubicO group peptidase (beta-lactamase class C family)
MPYTRYVTEHILEPVGLMETEFCPRADAPVGFARDCKGTATPDDFELPTQEADSRRTQSLCSSAQDLVKWQQALLSRAVFSERGSHRIMAPYVLTDGNSTNFGTAIQMSKLHDFKNYAYTGLGSGFRTRLSYWSLPKVTIVVLANCDSAEVERIERDIARFILSVPLPPTEEMKLTPEEAALCVGLYQIATTQYRIEWRDGQLWYAPPSQPATRLCHRGELVFAFESDREVTVTFHRTEGKCDGYTIYRGGFENKARRME